MSMLSSVIDNDCIEYMDLIWSLEMVHMLSVRHVGISAMFVVVSCIGYTMNVVASRTPCVLALVSAVLHAWA